MGKGKGRTENMALARTAKAARPLARVAPVAISAGDSNDCCALSLCRDLLPMVEYPAPAVDPFDGLPDCSDIFGRCELYSFDSELAGACIPTDTTRAKTAA